MRAEIHDAALQCGVPVRTSGVGSAFGLYVLERQDGEIDWSATRLLHLAAMTHGVYYGSGGEFGLCTALTDDDLARACDGLREALAEIAAVVVDRV
jgi:glutamate-1-semialdehyde aminotransferase